MKDQSLYTDLWWPACASLSYYLVRSNNGHLKSLGINLVYKETLFSQPSCSSCYLFNWKTVHPVITGWCKVILLLCLALTARTLASLHQGVAQGRGMVPGQVFHICSSIGQIYQSWQGLNDPDILLLLYLPAPCRKEIIYEWKCRCTCKYLMKQLVDWLIGKEEMPFNAFTWISGEWGGGWGVEDQKM